jgi:L-iditol 2-dehydrogenase
MKVGELYEIPLGIRIREIEEPKISSAEFKVRVKASGVCASDVKMAKRGHPIIDLYGLPFIGGHEFAGIVEEVGEGVRFVQAGDRVVVSWINPCLECRYCKLGLFQFCLNAKDSLIQPAGFSEAVKIPSYHQQTRVFPFPASLSFEAAAMTEPVACALNGVNNANIKIADTVVILGAGFMGLLLLQLSRLKGAARVIVVDCVEPRLKLAAELGAAHTIDFGSVSPSERVQELTEGMGADVVIEATGVLEAYKQAVRLGRKGSTVLYFGGLPQNLALDIDPNIIHYNQVTLKGSYSYTIETFRDALKLIEAGRIEVAKLITHRFPLEKLKEAIIKASEKDSLKVMIDLVP